jgi:hypothetical protein
MKEKLSLAVFALAVAAALLNGCGTSSVGSPTSIYTVTQLSGGKVVGTWQAKDANFTYDEDYVSFYEARTNKWVYVTGQFNVREN